MATAVPINVDLAILMIDSPRMLSFNRYTGRSSASAPRDPRCRFLRRSAKSSQLEPLAGQYITNSCRLLYLQIPVAIPDLECNFFNKLELLLCPSSNRLVL